MHLSHTFWLLVAGLTVGCTDAVSLSDPVEVATGNVEYQVQRNCAKFTIYGITLEEYTGEKENILFTELAQAATDTCWYGDCVVIDPQNKGGGTWSKPSSVTYNKEYFARLTGYPRENADGSISMAVYCIIPGTGVLENNKVWNAVNSAANDIQSSLGVTLSDVAVLLVPLPTTTEWDKDKGEDGDKDEEGFSTVGIYIAIPCGVVGIAIMVIIKKKACCDKARVDQTSVSREVKANKSNERNKEVRMRPPSLRANEFQFRYKAPPSYEPPPGYELTMAGGNAAKIPTEENQISRDEQTQEHSSPNDTSTQYTYAPVHTKY